MSSRGSGTLEQSAEALAAAVRAPMQDAMQLSGAQMHVLDQVLGTARLSVNPQQKLTDALSRNADFQKLANQMTGGSVAQMVARIQDQWNGDTKRGTLDNALQYATADVFKLHGEAAPAKEDKQAQQIYNQHAAAFQAYVRAQYQITQDYFAQAGVYRVPASRGLNFTKDPHLSGINFPGGGSGTFQSRPLSSFSFDPNVARTFNRTSPGDYLLKLEATIPASRILSVSATGLGVAGESELVVIGGLDSFDYIASIRG